MGCIISFSKKIGLRLLRVSKSFVCRWRCLDVWAALYFGALPVLYNNLLHPPICSKKKKKNYLRWAIVCWNCLVWRSQFAAYSVGREAGRRPARPEESPDDLFMTGKTHTDSNIRIRQPEKEKKENRKWTSWVDRADKWNMSLGNSPSGYRMNSAQLTTEITFDRTGFHFVFKISLAQKWKEKR